MEGFELAFCHVTVQLAWETRKAAVAYFKLAFLKRDCEIFFPFSPQNFRFVIKLAAQGPLENKERGLVILVLIKVL